VSTRDPRSGGPSRPARATIDDVAAAAGVSNATVSRALNGAEYVRQETRERVLAAAAVLGYRPSPTAQSLTTGRSMLIGIVVSDIEVPFFTTVARGIQNVAQRRGYLTLVGNSDEDGRTEDELVDAFMARMVDGLVISPSASANARLRAVAGSVPLVLVDRLVAGLDGDAVLSDNLEGARAATRHLTALGHRRIAYATDEPDKTSTAERLEGFRSATAEAGIAADPDLVWVVDYHADPAERRIRELLRRHRPTALIASEGSITLGALRAVQGLGLAVPGDISVIGFDQLDWGTATSPPMTVVSQNAEEIGARAARLLLRQLSRTRGSAAKTSVERVPTVLVERESCAPPRGDHATGGAGT
jgi:LacI family transcriptional regulator